MRVWKMLLNGENELKSNFDSKKIMDIIIINICYGSRLPTLDETLNQNDNNIIDSVMNLFSGAKIIS